jgi:thiol-disulfide isomerase/thioredoxin
MPLSKNRCGHCKSLAPAYTKAAEHLGGIFLFAAVDCDDKGNRALCQEFDVKGFPTIKLMKPVQGSVDVIGIPTRDAGNENRLYWTQDRKGTDRFRKGKDRE